MIAKVVDTKFKKEFDTKYGKMYQHGVFLEINGTLQWAAYNSKSKEQTKFVKGEEVEFTATEKEWQGRSYFQIKPAQAKRNFNSNFSRSLKKEQSRYSGFAMSYAKDLVVSGAIPASQMFQTAQSMLNWMVEQDKALENG